MMINDSNMQIKSTKSLNASFKNQDLIFEYCCALWKVWIMKEENIHKTAKNTNSHCPVK